MNKLLVVIWMCLLAPVLSLQIHAEDPDQIPIMAWLGVPPDLSTLERFKGSMTVTLEGEPQLKRVLKDGSEVDARTYINTLPVGPGDVLIYTWEGD